MPRSHPGGYSVNWRAIDGTAALPVTIVPFDGRHWETARASLGE